MIRALWASIAGLRAQMNQVDRTAHNLANINTPGFRRQMGALSDLGYVSAIESNPAEAPGIGTPVSHSWGTVQYQLGAGARLARVATGLEQGPVSSTGMPTDLAVDGPGFFMVGDEDRIMGYSRDGSFRLDGQGRLVHASGGFLLDEDGNPVALPEGYLSFSIGPDGNITARVPNEENPRQVCRLALARPKAESSILPLGNNLYSLGEDEEVDTFRPGEEGLGLIRQGAVEGSNVDMAQEMVELIMAQRAFELGSRVIQTTDQMLHLANSLRR